MRDHRIENGVAREVSSLRHGPVSREEENYEKKTKEEYERQVEFSARTGRKLSSAKETIAKAAGRRNTA